MATNWYSWFTGEIVDGCPCPLPMMEEFRMRFPEFGDLSDEQIDFAIQDAACGADSSWIEACQSCTTAIAFLAAHYLALQKMAADVVGGGSTDSEGGVTAGGQVTSIGFEGMRVSFASPTFSGGGGSGGSGGNYPLGSTPYGQRYLSLLKVNKPAVLIV